MIGLGIWFCDIFDSSEDEVLEQYVVLYSNFHEVELYELEHQSVVGKKNYTKSTSWNASQFKIDTLGCSIYR